MQENIFDWGRNLQDYANEVKDTFVSHSNCGFQYDTHICGCFCKQKPQDFYIDNRLILKTSEINFWFHWFVIAEKGMFLFPGCCFGGKWSRTNRWVNSNIKVKKTIWSMVIMILFRKKAADIKPHMDKMTHLFWRAYLFICVNHDESVRSKESKRIILHIYSSAGHFNPSISMRKAAMITDVLDWSTRKKCCIILIFLCTLSQGLNMILYFLSVFISFRCKISRDN